MLDHRCLRNIAGIYWDHRVSNSDVKRRVLGKDGKSVDEVMNLHRLRWLDHVSRMPEHRLPRRTMLTGVGNSWKKVRDDQTKTWHQSIKSPTSDLSHVGRCRLLGWGPRDYRDQWLETLGDMVQNCSQWRRCIDSLSSPLTMKLELLYTLIRAYSFFLYYILI
ncbi:unnamed protein product [Schistosoma curassoni]|uniref:Endonuclease-reverse transcriptase n=1 Tax=Schistosoma curassoni TaxID=6186 RepID=A0A183JEM4_9TREM|nr:unnamed protein product [Schistosoma curassoni]